MRRHARLDPLVSHELLTGAPEAARAYATVATLSADGPAAEELARDLLTLVRTYNRVYEAPMPYILALHQLADRRFHVHFELLPVGRAPGKLKLPASSESAYGFWLNDSLPEIKAAELHAAIEATRGRPQR